MDLDSLQLTFDDEFNSFTSSPDGTTGWMTSYPFSGENARTLVPNQEQEWYSDTSTGVNPFAVVNGVLDITAAPSAPATTPYHLSYTSGVITTYKSFAQLYGYFEIRAELPAGQGLWPAFWMLPADNNNDEEIDTFEMIGSKPTIIYNSIHDNAPGDTGSGEVATTVANTTTAFHTYGVDWEPDTITFYFDGTAVATMATPAAMDVPMYMLANLAVGGTFPGSPNSSTVFPATLQIDDVRAYATAATTSVSGTAAITLGRITGAVILNGIAQSGVTVRVIDASGNTVATTTSASSGAFTLGNINAGAVRVQYTLGSGTTFVAPVLVTSGHTIALSAGAFVAGATLSGSVVYGGVGQAGLAVSLLDSSGDVIATATTAANGNYTFIGLLAGSYQLEITASPGKVLKPGSEVDSATGLTAAIALVTGQSLVVPAEQLVAAATISGAALLNGVGEPGVTVTLQQADGTVLATTTTGANGTFSFTGLQAGTYQLLYQAPSGTVLQAGSEAVSSTGLSPGIAVAVGQSLTVGTEIVLTNPTTLQGSVHHYGASTDPSWGSGQAGVTVELLYAWGAPVATTVSDRNGWFAFSDLAAGSYQLAYVPQAGLALSAGSGVDPLTGLTAPFTLSAGTFDTTGIAAVVSTTGIAGQVLLAGGGEAGVSVDLLNTAGVQVATALTGVTGVFAFNSLATGTYYVHYVAPTGQAYQLGGPASLATGTTGAIAVAAGAGVALPSEGLVAAPSTISGSVHHYGSADPSWGSGQSGVVVTLLDSAGDALASKISDGSGWFYFSGLAAGNYELQFAPPAGEAIQPGGFAGTTGLTAAFAVSAGQKLQLPIAAVASSSNTFTLDGTRATAHRGDGNYIVTGNASTSVLTLGAGTSSVTLTGGQDAVTAGVGNQTITLGAQGGSVVHAGGGNVTITAGGANNLFDSGPGVNFLNADGSAGNVFMLNTTGQGLTTIAGFNLATTDVLDLARTLAGVLAGSSLADVGSYVTSAVSGSDTILYVDPSGTGTSPVAFAQLTGVTTSVGDLLAGNHLSLQ